MIILRKNKHTMHVSSRKEAQEYVNDGYEVVSNKLGGPKIVKSEAKKKKKIFKK